MNQAEFRFYGELNDFLPPERRMISFPHLFELSAPVKDMIEGFGVPHTEVDLILANGEPVDFSYTVRDADRISVYPMFESLDISPVARLRPQPLRQTRFVLDAHLGKLAVYLRMLGFDTLYRNDFTDHELALISQRERRILLTRDAGLLKHGAVTHGCYVRETDFRKQLAEILHRFDLYRSVAPFTRCLRCNAPLELATRELVAAKVPPRTRQYYDEFDFCPSCQRIYWKGSHYRRMQAFVERLLEQSRIR